MSLRLTPRSIHVEEIRCNPLLQLLTLQPTWFSPSQTCFFSGDFTIFLIMTQNVYFLVHIARLLADTAAMILQAWNILILGCISSFSSQQIALSRHRKSSIKLHSLKFLREIEMKMIRLLWQEDPKGLTRTAIVRFLRHALRTFYWNLPG